MSEKTIPVYFQKSPTERIQVGLASEAVGGVSSLDIWPEFSNLLRKDFIIGGSLDETVEPEIEEVESKDATEEDPVIRQGFNPVPSAIFDTEEEPSSKFSPPEFNTSEFILDEVEDEEVEDEEVEDSEVVDEEE